MRTGALLASFDSFLTAFYLGEIERDLVDLTVSCQDGTWNSFIAGLEPYRKCLSPAFYTPLTNGNSQTKCEIGELNLSCKF